MADSALQGTHASTAPADSGAGGLPQFDLAQWPGQMVWMLIIFGVMFALFARVFVPSVGPWAMCARSPRTPPRRSWPS
jgi:F-type H+-transporting ATPase subunit b